MPKHCQKLLHVLWESKMAVHSISKMPLESVLSPYFCSCFYYQYFGLDPLSFLVSAIATVQLMAFLPFMSLFSNLSCHPAARINFPKINSQLNDCKYNNLISPIKNLL